MVDESSSGNCPVCVDPFQIGDQVPLSLFKAVKNFFLQLLLPGCDASNQHACHPACLQGWLARLKTSFSPPLLILLCSGTALALCAGRLLEGRRRRAMMEETRMRRTSESSMTISD